jgi:uncharacterized protein
MQAIFIGENPRLEAIREGEGQRCAVITHPHPLYGGDMHNNVVMAARDAALSHGFSTLRFNFRGVGRSEGRHDHGRGEVDDLDAAVHYAGEHALIIGYSFGAWIVSLYLARRQTPCILISPPAGMFPFPTLTGKDIQILVGAHDQFCYPGVLKEITPEDRLTLVNDVDHFWFGSEDILRQNLEGILNRFSSA